MGYLTVEGRGGERLEWRFGNGEVWFTDGDDARRADSDAPSGTDADHVSEPPAPAYPAAASIAAAA